MAKKEETTLTSLSFLVPTNQSEDIAYLIEDTLQLQPAIISKPGLKLDKVVVYLTKKQNEEKVVNFLKDRSSVKFKVQRQELKETDWRDKWKEGLHPFKLTKAIKVIPSWVNHKTKSRLIEIQLDPGFAFGSGRHKTTQFVAQMIEKTKLKCQSLLDVGCGSGVLCLVAAKHNYSRILGIDNDPNSLTASLENAKKNKVDHITEFKTKKIESFKTSEEFDFIAANLESDSLIENAKLLYSLMGKNTYLAISGVLRKNRKKVHQTYKKLGLRCIRRLKDPEWSGYLYKKKKRRVRRVLSKIKRKKKTSK